MTQQKVAILAKDRLFRESLHRLLQEQGLEIAWEGNDVDALRSFEHQSGRADLVVIDLADGSAEDADKVANIRSACPDGRIVVLENDLDQETMIECFRRGADGYLVKDLSGEALVQCLKLALLGQKLFPNGLVETLTQSNALSPFSSETVHVNCEPLSDRQKQILSYLVKGEPDKVIAARLGITEATVKVHLKTLLKKINLRNRTQAAIWAVKSGLYCDDPGWDNGDHGFR